jgi:hypothetical protein
MHSGLGCGELGFSGTPRRPSGGYNGLVWIDLDMVGSRCTQAFVRRPAKVG